MLEVEIKIGIEKHKFVDTYIWNLATSVRRLVATAYNSNEPVANYNSDEPVATYNSSVRKAPGPKAKAGSCHFAPALHGAHQSCGCSYGWESRVVLL